MINQIGYLPLIELDLQLPHFLAALSESQVKDSYNPCPFSAFVSKILHFLPFK